MAFYQDILEPAFQGHKETFADLQRRLALSDGDLGQLLGVSSRTLRHWRLHRKPNLTALRLLAILAGYVPWDGWKGWEVERGYLFPPGYTKNGIKPDEFFAVVYYRSLAREYRRQIGDLEARLAAQDTASQAAREAHRGRPAHPVAAPGGPGGHAVKLSG